MAYSMTAYGRATGSAGGKDYTVELKSVNNRFFDCTVKVPSMYGFLEEKTKTYIQSKGINRGKLNVFIGIDVIESEGAEILVNDAYVTQYIKALQKLRDTYGLKDDITVSRIAQNKDVFTVKKPDEDLEKEWNELLPVLDAAIEAFNDMRRREGENLRCDLCEKMEAIKTHIDFIREHAEDAQKAYKQRLEAKLTSALEGLDAEIDQARIITECAIFADKTAIDEELVRLDSHYQAFYEAISSEDAVGRKLDFLFQEVNREINTIGSKVSDIRLTQRVVEVKNLLEKIREQIQNLE